jgi:hypothetical protein
MIRALSAFLFVAIETYVAEVSDFARKHRGKLSIVTPIDTVRGAP